MVYGQDLYWEIAAKEKKNVPPIPKSTLLGCVSSLNASVTAKAGLRAAVTRGISLKIETGTIFNPGLLAFDFLRVSDSLPHSSRNAPLLVCDDTKTAARVA